MAATYEQLNPRVIIRDALIDPAPSIGAGFAYPSLFGLPVTPEGGIARGRSIDTSGTPGALAGSIQVRAERDTLGAAAGQDVAQAIGAARASSERYPLTAVNFDLKQFSGQATEKLEYVANGFTAEEELHLARMAASSVWIKLESYAADFFTALAAEAGAVNTTGGWGEVDWQNDLGAGALGASNSTMEKLQQAVNAMRLSAFSPINTIVLSQKTMEKLQQDPQVLSRIVVGDAAAGVAAFNGMSVAPQSHVINVLKEHLGFEDVVVAGGVHQPDAAGPAYIWRDSRCWIGHAGDVDFSIRPGAAPRVLSGSGSFCMVSTKLMSSDIGPDAPTGAQNLLCTVDTIAEMVALQPGKGSIIHNLF